MGAPASGVAAGLARRNTPRRRACTARRRRVWGGAGATAGRVRGPRHHATAVHHGCGGVGLAACPVTAVGRTVRAVVRRGIQHYVAAVQVPVSPSGRVARAVLDEGVASKGAVWGTRDAGVVIGAPSGERWVGADGVGRVVPGVVWQARPGETQTTAMRTALAARTAAM